MIIPFQLLTNAKSKQQNHQSKYHLCIVNTIELMCDFISSVIIIIINSNNKISN